MNFREWLTQKYIDWRGEAIGNDRSISEFAEWIGVDQSIMSYWMNPKGKGITPRSQKNISKLAAHFPEVYTVLGIEQPQTPITGLDQLPPDFRDPLGRAVAEVNAEMARRGLTGDMPEAETLTIQIFEKYGFKYTATETEPD